MKSFRNLLQLMNLLLFNFVVLLTGDPNEVAQQEKLIYEIASKYRGMPAGEENGARGYMLTFAVAYLRFVLSA